MKRYLLRLWWRLTNKKVNTASDMQTILADVFPGQSIPIFVIGEDKEDGVTDSCLREAA